MALLLLGACSEEPAPPKPPSSRDAADAAVRELYATGQPSAPPETPSTGPSAAPPTGDAAAPATAEGAAAPQVKLVWDRISTLHRSFFADPTLKAALARDLAPYVRGTPEVEVGYDDVEVRGWIKLKVPPDGLLLPVRHEAGRVQIQDLSPLTVALDRYRLAMGSHYDLRLLNFRVRVEVRGGGRTCLFTPAGDPPADGAILSPCATVAGEALCGQASREGVLFSAADGAVVRACLGLPAD